MERSQVEPLAQVLLDSIGPRLVGTPAAAGRPRVGRRAVPPVGHRGAERAVRDVARLAPRGLPPRPRRPARPLARRDGARVEPAHERPRRGPRRPPPRPRRRGGVRGVAALRSWRLRRGLLPPAHLPPQRELGGARDGRLVRADAGGALRGPAGLEPRFASAGAANLNDLVRRLEAAGAAGVLTSMWTGGWGAERVFGTVTERMPAFSLSCEDYGLVARLAERGQGPRLRASVDAEFLGEVPTFNTIAEIRGTERPTSTSSSRPTSTRGTAAPGRRTTGRAR
jgi:carboxypeptidase Q